MPRPSLGRKRVHQKAATLDEISALPAHSGVVDVGAHIGDFGVPLAVALKHRGRCDLKVYCIDPSAEKCRFIAKVAELNHVSQMVTVINTGLGSEDDARYSKHVPPGDNSGAAQWRPAAAGARFTRLDVLHEVGAVGEVGRGGVYGDEFIVRSSTGTQKVSSHIGVGVQPSDASKPAWCGDALSPGDGSRSAARVGLCSVSRRFVHSCSVL